MVPRALAPWALLTVGVLMVASFFYGLSIGNERLESYQAVVKAVGEAQEANTKLRIAADKQRKEKADAKLTKDIAGFKRTIAGLRRDRPSSSFVPAAPAGSSRPDLICFDRAEYQRADGSFTEGARRLADEGTESTLGLDAAKAWAQTN